LAQSVALVKQFPNPLPDWGTALLVPARAKIRHTNSLSFFGVDDGQATGQKVASYILDNSLQRIHGKGVGQLRR